MSAFIEIKWHGKRFPIEFNSIDDLKRTTVKELKTYCSQMTGIEPDRIKLLVFGAVMNNDDMPLSIYGVRSRCSITLKTSQHNTHENKDSKEATTDKQHQVHKSNRSSEEDHAIERLENIKTKINSDIAPKVQQYEKDIKEFMLNDSKTEKDKKKQVYMGAYLGEQLMHILFDLDGVTCKQDFLDARQIRKETVKAAQMLLDRVDEIKSVVRSVPVVDHPISS
ncbi:hypothetical protein BCV72DRAFT_339002 [Rhizopus microsporus var. microsporus]|uniref:BAG domain-containing protein n=2 Tax=Rhizopus microsporus TaxID=58291 RepID=A0A2G4SXB0_RHIZD|nr:uncharacterized protein RHIMIDRAFT_291137 [Rhizopus microsporus ATCC 52813]ORE02047.1 hypothetical protein BCV72DRAFT_339002 [Rhizopus microsporus var. microsporus]PHZ13397.1 hypothetical protein RHIMIDRAFT_291137 [Rhizopus microsporus ATCC 52813]